MSLDSKIKWLFWPYTNSISLTSEGGHAVMDCMDLMPHATFFFHVSSYTWLKYMMIMLLLLMMIIVILLTTSTTATTTMFKIITMTKNNNNNNNNNNYNNKNSNNSNNSNNNDNNNNNNNNNNLTKANSVCMFNVWLYRFIVCMSCLPIHT